MSNSCKLHWFKLCCSHQKTKNNCHSKYLDLKKATTTTAVRHNRGTETNQTSQKEVDPPPRHTHRVPPHSQAFERKNTTKRTFCFLKTHIYIIYISWSLFWGVKTGSLGRRRGSSSSCLWVNWDQSKNRHTRTAKWKKVWWQERGVEWVLLYSTDRFGWRWSHREAKQKQKPTETYHLLLSC